MSAGCCSGRRRSGSQPGSGSERASFPLLPLDQEPPRPPTRFTARRPSTVRGVSPAALMTLAPPDTVAFGDIHSPTSSGQHPLLRLTVEPSNVRNLPVDPPIDPCPNSFLRGVTVEGRGVTHRGPPIWQQ